MREADSTEDWRRNTWFDMQGSTSLRSLGENFAGSREIYSFSGSLNDFEPASFLKFSMEHVLNPGQC